VICLGEVGDVNEVAVHPEVQRQKRLLEHVAHVLVRVLALG